MELNILNEREVLPATLHSLPIQIPIVNKPMIHDEIFPDLICPTMLNTKCHPNDLELNSPTGEVYDIDKYESIYEDNKVKDNILKSPDQLTLENLEVGLDIAMEGSGDRPMEVNLKSEVDVENISSHEILFPKIPIDKDDMDTKKREATTQTKIKDVRSKLEFILTENYDRIGYWAFEEKLQNVCGSKQADCYKCNQSFHTNIEKNFNLNQLYTEAVIENCSNIIEKNNKKEEAKELITTEQTQHVSTMHSEANKEISRGDKSKENNFVLKDKRNKNNCSECNQSFHTKIEKNINLDQIYTEALVENCSNIIEKNNKKKEAKELITTEQTQYVSTMHSEVNKEISRGDKSKDKESKENNFVLKDKSNKNNCSARPNIKIKKRLFTRFLNFFTLKKDKETSTSWAYKSNTF